MLFYNRGKHNAKLWLQEDDVQDNLVEQIHQVACLPFIEKHVAIMPDSHLGYGVPIGCVFATKGAVVPTAVGSDIGCGVMAVSTDLNISYIEEPTSFAHTLRALIEKNIPMGSSCRMKALAGCNLPLDPDRPTSKVITDNYESAGLQLGTLGGGNHFIELQMDVNTGRIWVMVHSGSRRLGHRVAKYHDTLAKKCNKKWHSSVVDSLAFFPTGKERNTYLNDMNYCVSYASLNRALIMKETLKLIGSLKPIVTGKIIDTCHNTANWEKHFGQTFLVHRKGATPASLDKPCIIPGSQGTYTYIGKGLGNEQSFCSCSHGAGRRMSRRAASSKLDYEVERKLMSGIGVISMKDIIDLDEAPSAYKDIDSVMEAQKDLIKPVIKLSPLFTVKG